MEIIIRKLLGTETLHLMSRLPVLFFLVNGTTICGGDIDIYLKEKICEDKFNGLGIPM